MLKPGGTLSLAVGSLSGAAAIGGGAIGASLAAASLSAGRPISGEPGGSGWAAAGAADGAGLAAGCWAAAFSVNAPRKAPASQRLRGAKMSLFILCSPLVEVFDPPAGLLRPVDFPAGVFDFFPADGNRKQSRSAPMEAE